MVWKSGGVIWIHTINQKKQIFSNGWKNDQRIFAFYPLVVVTIQRSFASNRRACKENNLQRIEKPNGLDQLGLPCRRPGFFNPLEKNLLCL
jgi:hypothetical protein